MSYDISSELHRAFVENVRSRRLDLGLTQAEAAKKLRISQSTYAHLESGRNTPTLEVVEKVAKALQTNPLQLLIQSPVAAR